MLLCISKGSRSGHDDEERYLPARLPVSLPYAGVVLALALCVINPVAVAQSSPYFGKIVAQIQFSPPRQPIDPIDLKARQMIKVGSPLNKQDVADTIDGLFGSGYYEDIQVDAEPSPAGVIVRFITTIKTFVGHV